MGLPLLLGASQLSVSPTIVILGASGTPTGVRRVEVRKVERGKGRMGKDERERARVEVERRGGGNSEEE